MPPSSVPVFQDIPDYTAVHAVALDELDSAVLKLAAEYWRSRLNGRRFPARGDLQPRDLAGILRDMVLVKIIEGGADYEYRIVGDAQAQAYTVPLQGRRISEISVAAPWFGHIAAFTYEYVRRSGEPVAMRGQPPIVWDHAEGFQVYDAYGNCWIDWSSGVVVMVKTAG